jgi:hypothetical protein
MVVAPSSTPSALIRLAAAAAGVALGVVVVLIALPNLRRPESLNGSLIFWMPIALFLITLAALCWWFALRGDHAESRGAIGATWKGGIWLGAPSFALGFIGPLVIWPHGNLGPLLGILLTGPLGFVCGALVALVFRKLRASP